MKIYLGVTDNNWFRFLSGINPEDVNFWQPGGNVNFKVLNQGAPFLFKLKSPLNAIGGVGFFSSHSFLPLNLAWEVFGQRNGCDSREQFFRMISTYRNDRLNTNPMIGCIVLTNPVFFKEEDWIETPANWGKSIVQGKSYDTADADGRMIWEKVELLLNKYLTEKTKDTIEETSLVAEPPPGYSTVLSKVRMGQGAFRVAVTEAYQKRCAISGEKTLPVLEAAHIKSYASSGPHSTSNGILLRSDLHKLFDTGYLTITTDHHVEVSQRIKEEFSNGKEYYRYHGQGLLILPSMNNQRPAEGYIQWHNENVFR
jgi:putative restriction endonuclease